MSILSNRASEAAAAAPAYIDAVLSLLGDQEPLEVLGSTASWCAALVERLPLEQVQAPESKGKWSIAGVLQHLADSELVWGYRIRKVLAEDRPGLEGFDQDMWAERLRYSDANASRALGVFSTLRAANLDLLNGLSSGDLARVGVHRERGEESIRHMMRLYAGHDLAHRTQLERIAGTVGR